MSPLLLALGAAGLGGLYLLSKKGDKPALPTGPAGAPATESVQGLPQTNPNLPSVIQLTQGETYLFDVSSAVPVTKTTPDPADPTNPALFLPDYTTSSDPFLDHNLDMQSAVMSNRSTWKPGQKIRFHYEVVYNGPTGPVTFPAPAQTGWVIESIAHAKR